MKIDHDYIKEILTAIEQQEKARPFLEEILETMSLDGLTEKFLLHYEVLFDYGFIQSLTANGSLGIDVDSSGEIYWSDAPIRLTATGHEFIEALNQSDIWSVIKSEFRESSIKTIFKVATDLAQGIAKKQVEQILSENL